MNGCSFQVIARCPDTAARAGILTLRRASVETPLFMPVGTQATVKCLTPDEVSSMGAALILANAYHLFLRPGEEVIRAAGGLHRFMNWSGAILTDSGGFQIFSLRSLRKVTDDGVAFRSHIDGSEYIFTPEGVIRFQEVLGSDIIMPLDECLPYPCDYEYARRSMRRTLSWAKRSKEVHAVEGQSLFGIVQGGTFLDLRRESAGYLTDLGFCGFSMGGLSVGEPKEIMHEVLEYTVPLLPQDRPRYLMGVGKPEDFFECVERGIDMFDCVLPTRMARAGSLLTNSGKLVLKNTRFRNDHSPPDENCKCYTCRHFSRAYLRHLFVAEEILGPRLATVHNLHFTLQLLSRIRESIRDERFLSFKREFLERCAA